MARLDLGVLVSGSGTNLQAILDAIQRGDLDADVRMVLSNRDDAYALERAQKAGVRTQVLSHRGFADRTTFDLALVETLRSAGATTIALAGFMRVLTPTFLEAFAGRVINIHPALLPSFPGTHAQGQALRYGVKIAGCTVHFVDAGTDTGPIIAQAAVPVHEDDTEESLQARILKCEHELFVSALRWMSEDRVKLVIPEGGGRATVSIRGAQAGLLRAGREL